MKNIVWFSERSQKTQGITDLRWLSSDYRNGLWFYFTITSAFLIIASCSQTDMGKSSFKSVFYFSKHTFWKIPKISRGTFLLFIFFLQQFLYFELQGLTAVLVLLGDFFTMWINQCYELGPWGFGNVIGFRWHFASQSVKQPNVDTAEQFQLFPLAPSSFPGRHILCLYFCLPFLIVTLLN